MSIRPAFSLHGERVTSVGFVRNGTAPAPASGIEFEGNLKCAANHGTCSAPRAKGTELCIGHLRSLQKKAQAEVDAREKAVADEQG